MLACVLEDKEVGGTNRVPKDFEEIPAIKRIRSMLLAPPQGGNTKKVLKRLENFWREMNRGVVIDAGTTNDQTINKICDLNLPTSFSSLAELFMKSAGVLSFGLGIVGTTMVNIHDMTLNSDSHEEASLKALMFQKNGLSVLVAS